MHDERTAGHHRPSAISSRQAREQVARARERQASRLAADGVSVNAHMDSRMLRAHVRLDRRCEELLSSARRSGVLSARGEDRVLRVARTIADLDERERIGAHDLGAAIAMRSDALLATGRPT